MAAVAALAVVAYANTLGNGFVWDDGIILTRQLVVFRSLSDVLTPPHGIPQFSPDYYRPLTIASLLLDRALGGERPVVYHLSVVWAHALTASLVCWLGLQVLGSQPAGRLAALFAAALFAVHPIHTESVAWMAGRSDVLATGFLLAAMVAHWGGRWSWPRAAVTGVLLLAALGAKETAITGLPLLCLGDLLLDRRVGLPVAGVRGGWLRRAAGPLAAVAVYAGLRRMALGEFVGHAPDQVTVHRSVVDLLGAVGAYAAKLAVPVHLQAFIDRVPTDAASLAATAVGGLGVIGIMLYCWRMRQRLPIFLTVWIALTLAPSLTIVWKIPEAPMAERYLYLPSVGWCLLLGYALRQSWQRWPRRPARRAMAAGAVLLVGGGLLGTVLRNRVWHDNISLWSDSAAKSRTSGMAWRSLGAAYQEAGRFDEARRAFEAALQRQNSQTGLEIIYSNLGTLALQTRDYTAAIALYERALVVQPTAADVLFNLGLATLWAGGGTAEAAARALPFYERAQALSPYDADIQAGLGQALVLTGDRTRAVGHLRRALELHPRPATAESIRTELRRLE